LIKKSKIVIITIFCLMASLARGTDSALKNAKELAENHQAAVKAILEKEKSLAAMRLNPSKKSLWNFAERNRREQTIQQRSRLNNEINILKQQAESLRLKMSAERPALYDNLKKPDLLTADLIQAVNYLDKLEFDRLSSFEFLEEADIGLKSSPEKTELLKTIYAKQSLILDSVRAMTLQLEAKNKALKGKFDGFLAENHAQILKLGEILLKGQISQDLIQSQIKQSK